MGLATPLSSRINCGQLLLAVRAHSPLVCCRLAVHVPFLVVPSMVAEQWVVVEQLVVMAYPLVPVFVPVSFVLHV